MGTKGSAVIIYFLSFFLCKVFQKTYSFKAQVRTKNLLKNRCRPLIAVRKSFQMVFI